MTVENVTPIIRYPYTGPGSYSFSFLIYDEDDLTITHTDTLGNRTVLTKTTDYTVTINSGSSGGSVTTTYSETTGVIEISRVLEYTQNTNWENEGALDMELLEQDFDKIVMLLQQLKAEFYRAPAQANLRGAWATATAYVEGDVVWDSVGEVFYACYTAHTSGTLATDVAAGYWFDSLDLTSIYADAINAAVDIAVATKADIASPTLTGTPTAPTATAGTETTQIATTEYVIDTAERRRTAVSGLPMYGNVVGFDITKTGANELTVTKGTCLDFTGLIPLALTADTAVSIPATANTIYHLAAVRLVSDGSITVKAYTSEAAIAADGTINAYRWIDFWRTNGSSQCVVAISVNGLKLFGKASENVVSSGITTSYATVTHSSFIPESRVEAIKYGARDASVNTSIIASEDGTNTSFIVGYTATTVDDTAITAWGTGANTHAPLVPYTSSRQFKSASGTVDLLIHIVKVRR